MEAYTVQTRCQILFIPIQHLILDLEGLVVHLGQLVKLPGLAWFLRSVAMMSVNFREMAT